MEISWFWGMVQIVSGVLVIYCLVMGLMFGFYIAKFKKAKLGGLNGEKES